MDDTEDDARYPANPSSSTSPFASSNYPHNLSSSSHPHHHRHRHRQQQRHQHRPKLPFRNPNSGPPPIHPNFYNRRNLNHQQPHYGYDDDDDDDDDDERGDHDNDDDDGDEDDDRGAYGGQGDRIAKRMEVDDEEDDGEDDGNEDDDDDDEDDDDDDDESGQFRKKRRLENFEFAPRLKVPQIANSVEKPSFSGLGRNSSADWSEQATFALLDAWGDRHLQLGGKNLRSEDWAEVAERVSQAAKTPRTDSHCRNRLDSLKRKYKKEKMRMEETGNSAGKWVYFKKMDMLMGSSPPRQQPPGLACGLDSGEYVFLNHRVYLNRSNGLDELRDSPGNSESEADDDGEGDSDGDGDGDGDGEDEDSDSEGLPPVRNKNGANVADEENGGGDSSSFRLLADSIQKFGETYEKVENNKRQQMMELEKLRIEFHRDLEMQKKQILERAQAEIAKIRQGVDEEVDVSVENTSG